jgi:hypothetical protein
MQRLAEIVGSVVARSEVPVKKMGMMSDGTSRPSTRLEQSDVDALRGV